MKRAWTWLALALLAAPHIASADGRMYAGGYAPEIADQRALIAFDGQRQVTLIESHVGLADGRPVPSLGWVVPVPAVPEIAVANASSVRRFYRQVRSRTDPEPWRIGPWILVLLPVAFLFGGRLINQNHPDGKTLRSAVWLSAIGVVLAAVSIPVSMPTAPPPGVEVVKALRAGPLDAKVVRAASGSELVDWLKKNDYVYGNGDVAAIEDYLRRKWLFVVAKLSPEAGATFEGASATPPLVLSFPTREPVYPVALTAAGGQPLDLVLYVYAPAQVAPSAAMKTAFAGAASIPGLYGDENKAAAALISALSPEPRYLTKVTKKLSPDEMSQDIRFAAAPDKGDFRESIVGRLFLFWIGGAFVMGAAAALLHVAGGRERWRVSGPAWFMISMLISWPLALLFLLGSIGRQYWRYRKERVREDAPAP